MSIDTSEFLDVLMEDSMEALSDMETSLLELDNGGDDAELINTIFRGAHSIKGGSGMLGLEEIAGFTHLMETLLDQVREGERKIDMPIIGLLLECVDALRGMFDALKEGSQNDATQIEHLKERLSAMLENREPNIQKAEPPVKDVQEAPAPTPEPEVVSEQDPEPNIEPESSQTEKAISQEDNAILDELAAADAELAVPTEAGAAGVGALLTPADDFVMPGWAVQFVPDHDLFLSGYDPLELINQLAEFGGIDVKCDANVMPGLQRINPEQCYLAWDINIITEAGADAIRAVFAPVMNQCELIIEPLQEAHAKQLRAIIADQEANRKDVSGQDAVSYLRETVLGGNNVSETEVQDTVGLAVDVPAGDEAFEPLERPEVSPFIEEPVQSQISTEDEPEVEAMVQPLPEAEPDQSVAEAYEPVDSVSGAVQEAGIDAIQEPEAKDEPVTEEKSVPSERANVSEKTVAAEYAPAPAAKQPVSKTSGRIARERKNSDAGGSIRVSTQKIDALINMAGELVITQAMLAQLGEKLEDTGLQEIEHLRDGLAELERNSRELQDAVMSIRMLPISFAFSRFPRMIRDLTTKMDKKVRLVTTGEQTELDKTVMEKIGDPLVHLVRNSFDHGIEMPEDRRKAGKDEVGTIELNAYHQGGNIVIEVADDGKGLDKAVIIAKAREKGLLGEDEHISGDKALELIFEPGFSTATEVSDLSGRGVGMDVVRRNIRDLGGHIDLESTPGQGTRFTIRLPLTLAILDGQLVTVGEETFIIPLISIVESLQIRPEQMKTVAGQNELYQLREDYIPVVKLNELFDIKRPTNVSQEHDLLVVVEGDGEKIALQVDDLLGQQQAFIKSLETNFKPVTGVSGATILGDGTVSLILDAGAIVRMARKSDA